MPEITVIHIAILAGSIAVGAVIGWLVRGNRCAQEKMAVNEGWSQQLEAQRTEHERLQEQNRNLMEQVSQFQASGKDATNRARELSDALKEAFERRDELQRELKEIRSNLELALRQREKLQSDMKSTEARGDSAQTALKKKDDKIFRLSRELENWQNRLPPLIERFRQRDEEAVRLEEELADGRARIDELESRLTSEETTIEPVDPEALGDELDASNDPGSMTQTEIEEVLAEGRDDDTAVLEQVGAEDSDYDDVGAAVETREDIEAFAEEPVQADEPRDDLEDVETPAELTEETRTSAEVTELRDHEPGSVRDNLRLIKGIGPAIEKTLNELGIFRFHQIAELSEYDINRVAQRLKGFRTRIYREDWIGQARDLQLQKSGT